MEPECDPNDNDRQYTEQRPTRPLFCKSTLSDLVAYLNLYFMLRMAYVMSFLLETESSIEI